MIYDFLFVGATALAVGGCLEAAERGYLAAVIEPLCSVGDEFAQAWRWESDDAPLAERGRGLIDELILRNAALDYSRVSMPALGPVLAARLKTSGAQAYFLSEIVELKREDCGYRARFVTCGHFNEIRARAVIDTSADFGMRFFLDGETKPAINASLSIAITPPDTRPALPTRAGRFDDELYLSLAAEPGESLSSARLRALELRRERPELFGGARVIELASALDRRPLENGRRARSRLEWRPSAAYKNAAQAMDAGAALIDEALFSLPAPPVAAPRVTQERPLDALVAGLGTAGSIALIVAAKSCLRAEGLESFGCMGGSATLGTVTGYYFGVKGGYYREIDRETERLRAETSVEHAYAHTRAAVLQRECDRFNARARVEATVCGALTRGARVTGLIWKDADGFHKTEAKYVIDATGNADVAALAGCELINGRASDSSFMAFSLCHRYYDNEHRGYGYGYRDNGFIDPRDAAGFGRTLLRALSEDNQLQEQYAAQPRYLGAAPFIGVREGARIAGEETVRLGDILRGRLCERPAYWCFTNIDQHNKDHAFESPLLRAWFTVCGMWGYNLGVPIPAGALIPGGWDGLLCAGRAISMDHDAALGLRMRDECSKSGEVASTLAALAIAGDRPARNVEYAELRRELMKTGCLKPEDGHVVRRQRGDAGAGAWLTDIASIREALSSDRPGIAIWSAKLLGDAVAPQLREWTRAGERRLSANAALALGLMGDAFAEDALLELASDKTGYTPDTSWMYVPQRAVSAICALGLMACERAIPLLLSIIKDKLYASQIPFLPNRFTRDREDLYFQYFTHAFVALVEIGKAHAARRARIASSLKSALEAPGFAMRSTMMDTDALRPDMRPTLEKLLNELC